MNAFDLAFESSADALAAQAAALTSPKSELFMPPAAKSMRIPSTAAPSSLANFDSFRTPQKRPRLDSVASSGSSVPSLASTSSSSVPSSASSSSYLSPTYPAFGASGDELSPLDVGARSPLDPSLFAAMQDAWLSKAPPTWDPVSLASLSSAPLESSPTAPMPPLPHRQSFSSRPLRRSSTHSPRLGPSSSTRAPRPPPLDLSSKSYSNDEVPTRPVRSEPMQAAGSQEDMDRVLWEINALLARDQAVSPTTTIPPRPAPCPLQPPSEPVPHFNVAGVTLDLGDLELLAARPAVPTRLPSTAPAYMSSFGPILPDGYPATAPAFDLLDPFASHPTVFQPYPTYPPYAMIGGQVLYGAGAAGEYYPTPYIAQRRASAAVPLIDRPRSAPTVNSLACARRASAPTSKRLARKTSFVNFSSKDANKLLSGVAPSGSSKRRRDEDDAAAAESEARTPAKRRVVSAP